MAASVPVVTVGEETKSVTDGAAALDLNGIGAEATGNGDAVHEDGMGFFFFLLVLYTDSGLFVLQRR